MMRWIVVDMDGTLLNSQKIITDLTKETIIDMQKSGYRFILASGRPTSGTVSYTHLKNRSFHICLYKS